MPCINMGMESTVLHTNGTLSSFIEPKTELCTVLAWSNLGGNIETWYSAETIHHIYGYSICYKFWKKWNRKTYEESTPIFAAIWSDWTFREFRMAKLSNLEEGIELYWNKPKQKKFEFNETSTQRQKITIWKVSPV